MNLRCLFGHKKKIEQEFLPSMYVAELQEYSITTSCERCGKVLRKIHEKWDERTESFYPMEDDTRYTDYAGPR